MNRCFKNSKRLRVGKQKVFQVRAAEARKSNFNGYIGGQRSEFERKLFIGNV